MIDSRRLGALVVVLVLVIGACTGDDTPASSEGSSDTAAATTDADSTTTGDTATTTTVPGCPDPLRERPPSGQDEPEISRIDGADPTAGSIAVSEATFRCAEDAVVALGSDLDLVAIGARLATGLGGPLLLGSAAGSPALDAELARLAPARLLVIGPAVVTAPDTTALEVLSGAPADVADRANLLLGARRAIELPEEEGVATVAAAIVAIDESAGLAFPVPPPPPTTTVPPTTGTGSTTTTTQPATTTTTTTTTVVVSEETEPVGPVFTGLGVSGVSWFVDDDAPALAMVTAVAAVESRGFMALVDGTDLRANIDVARVFSQTYGGASAVTFVGDITEHADWQIEVLADGRELPGGGLLLFPGRRIVAFYGNPLTTDLGVLGEQGPQETIDRMTPIAQEYAEPGIVIVPSFEIIATVAAGQAGADNNYSNEMELDLIRPWIEIAREQGIYVLLDLQPGRTDFLTQAKIYDEFLREPHVGLALDPEWRLGPDEVHLVQVGSVSAAEINTVVEYLAEMVREEHLPQKMLLLHQFRFGMIPDRENIVTTPELATVFQMDGQGRISDKYATWNNLTRDTEQYDWWWGWKNFYDEDIPGPITPEEVLTTLDPSVVYVSYQ